MFSTDRFLQYSDEEMLVKLRKEYGALREKDTIMIIDAYDHSKKCSCRYCQLKAKVFREELDRRYEEKI